VLSYASQYWSSHLSESARKDPQASDSDGLSTLIKRFLSSAGLTTWISVYSIFDAKQSEFPSDWILSIAKVGVDVRKLSFAEGVEIGIIKTAIHIVIYLKGTSSLSIRYGALKTATVIAIAP